MHNTVVEPAAIIHGKLGCQKKENTKSVSDTIPLNQSKGKLCHLLCGNLSKITDLLREYMQRSFYSVYFTFDYKF